MFNFRIRICVALTISALAAGTVDADPPHRHRGHGHPQFDRHPHFDHHPHWHRGHWHRGHHDGRFGWWWVVAGSWYLYPAPVYPYPDPYRPPVVIVDPEPAQPRDPVWYFCESSDSYYPYASVCPEGWQAVPAQPRDAYER